MEYKNVWAICCITHKHACCEKHFGVILSLYHIWQYELKWELSPRPTIHH